MSKEDVGLASCFFHLVVAESFNNWSIDFWLNAQNSIQSVKQTERKEIPRTFLVKVTDFTLAASTPKLYMKI